jgi:sortase A
MVTLARGSRRAMVTARLVVPLALLVSACNAAGGHQHALRRAGGARVTTTVPSVSSTTDATATPFDDPAMHEPPTTTSTAVPLPQPTPPPSDPYAAVPVRQIGVIAIPRIGLVHPIYDGIWLTVIDHGPGHWPGTAMPGQLGNTVFPGHRVTHTHPFLNLDQLRPGDSIVFEMPYGTYTYSVRDTIIVQPTDMWVVDQHRDHEVTLIACHPKHSAAERIVVQGVLVRSAPKGT